MSAETILEVIPQKEALWNQGPNYAADAVILTEDIHPKILLIKRSDTGDWALPGGFVNEEETSLEASRREACEETGLVIDKPSALVFRGKVNDPRNSETAWIETSAYLYTLPHTEEVKGNDDATEAQWFPIDNLPYLYGSHADIVRLALDYTHPSSLEEIILLPSELLTIQPADGGHMAYDHLFVSTPKEMLFVKKHDSTQFTDPNRELHSRQYLQKEAMVFSHLRTQDFPAIPERTALIEDHTLIMDALHVNDGWCWRAPKNENLTAYIQSTLHAFKQLEAVPLPKDEIDITPTIVSFNEEGWLALDDKSLNQVRQKIDQFIPQLHAGFRESATELSNSLEALRDTFNNLPTPTSFVLAHHDARQANLAWHPTHGTKLVDWSWAGPGRAQSDSTAFLIDLAKSGHDVAPYLSEYFSREQAIILIGFWLGHSLWQTKDGNQAVRFHQVASAVSAFRLLGN